MKNKLLALKIGLTDEEEIKEFARLIEEERKSASQALRLIIEGRMALNGRRS